VFQKARCDQSSQPSFLTFIGYSSPPSPSLKIPFTILYSIYFTLQIISCSLKLLNAGSLKVLMTLVTMTSVTRLFICLGLKSYLPLTATDNTSSPLKWRPVSRYQWHSTVHQHNSYLPDRQMGWWDHRFRRWSGQHLEVTRQIRRTHISSAWWCLIWTANGKVAILPETEIQLCVEIWVNRWHVRQSRVSCSWHHLCQL
jgi:hypothetical protein